jgi:Ca2+-binding RTX toxin-like protein
MMLGGTGDDLLMGGAGQDMIVGGVGADRIEGNADEDILIAGFTLYDGNAAALSAIFAEWTSNNSYAARVANITGGTGLTQGFRLWGADGANQTVFNDNDHDVLAGGAGIDWFFANLNGGGTLDSVSDLRANELWTDTDF